MISDPALPAPPDVIQVTADGIFYTFSDPVASSSRGDPASAAGQFPSYGPQSEAQSTVGGQAQWSRLPRKHLRWTPLGGGGSQELLSTEHASTVQVRGGYCYWVRSPRTGSGALLSLPVAARPQGDLMVAPVAGGQPWKIARVADDVTLQPCGEGVCWRQFTTGHAALLSTDPPDFDLEAFPDYPSRTVPLRLGERLYWFAGDGASPPFALSRSHRLVTARRDGSDQRMLWEADTDAGGSASLGNLLDDGRDLYFTIEQLIGSKLKARLVRYRLSAEPRTETLFQTALGASSGSIRPITVERNCLYFMAWEERENWFDWSRAGLMRRRVGVLRRFRLSD